MIGPRRAAIHSPDLADLWSRFGEFLRYRTSLPQRKLTAGLDRLDAMVPGWEDAFHIGHIAVGCILSYLDFRYAERDWRRAYPALALWHADFCARPSPIATEVADD